MKSTSSLSQIALMVGWVITVKSFSDVLSGWSRMSDGSGSVTGAIEVHGTVCVFLLF